jgi:hypothetical protein
MSNVKIRPSQDSRSVSDFVPEFGEHFAGYFDLLRSLLRPGLSRGLQPVIGVCEIGCCRFGQTRGGEFRLELSLGFHQFRKHNFFFGNTAKLSD